MLHLVAAMILAIFTVDASRIRPRIIDGDEAFIEAHPYQVSLHYSGKFNCGGTIIWDQWILTAGHCINKSKGELTVRSGTSLRNRGGVVSKVDDVIVHKLYNKNSRGVMNDVALVHLTKPLSFSDYQRPIALAEKNWILFDGTMAIVTGWGKTVPSLKGFSEHLRKVEVPIVNIKKCHQAYRRIFFQDLPEGQICAGYLGTGSKDACRGDSGGPLVVNGYLVGLVSYGNGCGSPKFPGVYTDIAYYRDWIRQHSRI